VATGYYLVRWRTGEDIRSIGTGTTGAFNVMRRLGAGGFWLTSAGDLLKGMIAVALARLLSADSAGQLLALIAVVIGHNFPLQLRGRGGNGLATLTGALLIFDVGVWLMLAGVFAGSVGLILLLRFFKLPVQVYTPAKITVLCVPLAAWVLRSARRL
jgi:glycerol-3-phosphate acyltransferase PlsY